MKCESFWTSCKNAISLIWSNAASISIVSGFGSMFEFLGSLAIAFTTAGIGY